MEGLTVNKHALVEISHEPDIIYTYNTTEVLVESSVVH